MSDGVSTNFIGRLSGQKPEFDENILGAGAHIAKAADENVFNAKERYVDLSSVSAFCAKTT